MADLLYSIVVKLVVRAMVTEFGRKIADRQLSGMTLEHRQAFGDAFARLVEIEPFDPLTMQRPPRIIAGPRVEQHLTHVSSFLNEVYDPQQEPDAIWDAAIESVLMPEFSTPAWSGKRANHTTLEERYTRHELALVMAYMADQSPTMYDLISDPRVTFSVDDLLHVNARVKGLGLQDKDGGNYVAVAREQRELVRNLLEHGQLDGVIDFASAFDDLSALRVVAQKRERVTTHELYTILHKMDKRLVPPSLEFAAKLFGNAARTETVVDMQSILDGRLDSETVAPLKLRHSGEAGVSEIATRLSRIKNKLYQGKIPTICPETLEVQFTQSILRYNEAEWRPDSDDDEFIDILRGKEHAVAPYFTRSRIEVARIAKHSEVDLQVPEPAIHEYESFMADLGLVNGIPINQDKTKNPFIRGVADFCHREAQSVEYGILQMTSAYHAHPTRQLQDAMIKAGELENVLLSINPKLIMENRDYFMQLLPQLARQKKLLQPLRQLLLHDYMISHDMEDAMYELGGNFGNPSFKNLNTLQLFIRGVQESGIWKSEGAYGRQVRVAVKTILGGASMQNALDRYNTYNEQHAQKTTYGIIPTRGPLMEFSGHIADACWSRQYGNIAHDSPNATSVLFVRHPNTERAQFAGASMLLEAESTTQEPLLIVRGLNPLETDINMLDKASFVSQFTNYVRRVAARAHRKPAIVIERRRNDFTGPTTNRMQLFDYLEKLRPSLQHVAVRAKDTTFNDSDVTKDVYFL